VPAVLRQHEMLSIAMIFMVTTSPLHKAQGRYPGKGPFATSPIERTPPRVASCSVLIRSRLPACGDITV